jgi:hypothetical protein
MQRVKYERSFQERFIKTTAIGAGTTALAELSATEDRNRPFMLSSYGREASAHAVAQRRMPLARSWMFLENRSNGCTRPDRWDIPADRSTA